MSMQKADRRIERHDNDHLTEILKYGSNFNWPISRGVKYNWVLVEVLMDYYFHSNLSIKTHKNISEDSN